MARMTETAEWLCTRCGSSNRRLVKPGVPEAADRCVHCHVPHRITRSDRPVRWEAKLE